MVELIAALVAIMLLLALGYPLWRATEDEQE